MFRRRRNEEPDVEGTAEEFDQSEALGDADAQGGHDGGVPAGRDSAGDSAGDREGEPAESLRPDGPFDASEVDLMQVRTEALDLGAVLVRPSSGGNAGISVQLQVDQNTSRVTSVLLREGNGGLQLSFLAAPRSRGLWAGIRESVTADAERQGARLETAQGPFGPELRVLLPVAGPDGGKAIQPTRILGIDGPRWFIRADFLGAAALEQPAFQSLFAAMCATVVIRGNEPMAPGEALPLTMPPQAQRTGDHPDGPAAGLIDDPGADAAAGQATEADASGEPRSAGEPESRRDGRPLTLEDLEPGPTITEIR